MNLREFVDLLAESGRLRTISREVSPEYEVAALMAQAGDTPLLFTNVAGSRMPVVTNICASRELVALGLGCAESEIMQRIATAGDAQAEVPRAETTGYHEVEPTLAGLPILTHQKFDGGPYIASAIAAAHDGEHGLNLSYHRGMKLDDRRLVLRILPRNLEAYRQRGLKEFAFCNGVSVPVLLGAATSFGIDVSEMAIANALGAAPLIEVGGHTVPQSELVMVCEFTGEMADEGPFLDLTETRDIVRSQPVVRLKRLFLRDDSIFHALLPGGPEHKVLMGMPREPTIFHAVSQVTDCVDVHITPGGSSWLHAIVSIRPRTAGDGRKAIEAAFAGHASLKHVWVVND
ncbi:MAG: UbiD family decarboxylase, partial [Candidatus Poseidoniia archaeon]|nr:UbiD family decarboxylase [Candidatus Poseidoniia archaeon]